MKKSAIISDDKKYRYSLSRIWDETKSKVLFIMLNPSTADDLDDDNTIRRCIAFAKDWGFGGILVSNLFAYRSTKPNILLKCVDPIGNDNAIYINELSLECEITICAWGNGKIVNKLLKKFDYYKPLINIKNLHYLELCNDGTPKHPLYLKKELKPIKYLINVEQY